MYSSSAPKSARVCSVAALIHLVSDIHLQADRPETVRLFRGYLAGPARGASALYILGDLFEYWAGDDCLGEPGSFESGICADLRRLAESGTALHFLAGNRDFLAGDRFAAAASLHLLPDAGVADLAGTPTLLLHGDTLCTDDVKYQAFRQTVRAPEWREQFLARSLPARLAEIDALRRRSRTEISKKPADLMDANADTVATAFRAHGVTRMVHGHTHRQGHHAHPLDGLLRERWVLGDWSQTGSYLLCDDSGCQFVPVVT